MTVAITWGIFYVVQKNSGTARNFVWEGQPPDARSTVASFIFEQLKLM